MMHGVMFHHFHDKKNHIKIQGSISRDGLFKIIKYIGRENILSPEDFIFYFKNNNHLKKVCFTFDDCLKSQIDIAIPLLEEFNIKSFFFIYTGIFEKKYNLFEVFRVFRNKAYKNLNIFYNDFEIELLRNKKLNLEKIKKNKKKIFLETKKKFKFYSMEDIYHRYYRDEILDDKGYADIMINLMKEKNFNLDVERKKILINENDLKRLVKLNHTIGLHSHSHPTNIDKLSYKKQYDEYSRNKSFLEKIINKKIISVSYPNGKYNKDSKAIMKKLGIEFGFISSMQLKKNTDLEILREDHSNIIKRISS